MSDVEKVKTPCIGICSTVYGDIICRGCKRYAHEVIAWNNYSEEQKKAILQRLDTLLEQIMQSKIYIMDLELLATELKLKGIRYNEQQSPYCWAYQLFRAGANQIRHISDFGIMIHAEYEHIALTTLKEMIDNEYYQLSEAHYQRYIHIPLSE